MISFRRIGLAVVVWILACSQPGDDPQFQKALSRDLSKYFGAPADYELLRKQPTQSGPAAPKYYAWVRVHRGADTMEGAVRVANIDDGFEVTDFLPADQIRQHPQELDHIFPAPLCPRIRELAK